MKGTYVVFLNQGDVDEVELFGLGELPTSKIIVKPAQLNFPGNTNATFTIKGPAGVLCFEKETLKHFEFEYGCCRN